MTTKQDEHLAEVGANALASIREMVAALECDYERLEELRDERDCFEMDDDANEAEDGPGYANSKEAWAAENPDDAEELKELEEAAGDCTDQDEARERIQEDALSLEFRSGWVTDWKEAEPEEYCLLLATGGPAVRIIGEIRNGEAHSARLQVQDWGTPWTEHITTGSESSASECL
jgi:hypothetical protein